MTLTDSPWQAIATAALIGTTRQPFQPPPTSGQLGYILSQLQAKPPETALLLAAATVALHQRVGWLPPTVAPASASPCPAADLPRCSPRASRCLQQILQGPYPQLLPEWLHLAAIAQQRVPEMHLPALLDKGRQTRQLRPAIVPVLGQRGRWLAAQNPDWSYAVALTTDTDWETGTTAARLLALQELRSHQPDLARELLQATWSQEAASDRAKFLETLQTGLSLADEPFLEQALGDRSKEVRRVAADLLASLPDSRLCQHVAVALSPYLSLKRQPDLSLQVQLPDHFDPTWTQLGIDQKPITVVNTRLGEKAWWLLQMIGSTPLQTWSDRWQLSSAEIIELTRSHEWQLALLGGWALAAKRQHHDAWLAAIFKVYFVGHASFHDASLIGISIEDLFKALSHNQQDQLLVHLLRIALKKINDSLTIWLLRYSGQQWSVDLAHLVLEQLEQHLNHTKTFSNSDWELRSALKEFAQFIPASFTSEVIELRSRLNVEHSWMQSMDELLMTLQFRQEMTQAFEIGMKSPNKE
ncbi:MAG: DUF5691 domain-containing protein [Leptolyngbyaceae cyanobacterium bins.349]|nr:DUF5691 domain-containing protein [Leptolyngbyaceae cyanobacterium bins.349]